MDECLPSTSPVKKLEAVEPLEECHICKKMFKCVKLRNRHVVRVHKVPALNPKASCNIYCPLCEEKTFLKSHEGLRTHLQEFHQVRINQVLMFEFSSELEFRTWKDAETIDANFAICRLNKERDHKMIYYDCNRSDIKGYKPNYKSRTEKSGGTIKIKGVCPSRLICKVCDEGKVSVSYWTTHVGHEDELRTKHLSNLEKKGIVEKLQVGVQPSRILEDSRKLEAPILGRINVLTGQDISYLSKKHNIKKNRDQNEMVAAEMKVQEWNANGKNHAFLFKKEGEAHSVLKKEDFALAFMNLTMEAKLRQFPDIICMDGTHGTNKRGMDLTVLLIKDDRNAGFPVAFLLSNRLDQQIQEVFLAALKDRMQMNIQAKCFMSDDDPKYYNAWINIMNNSPQRLLCTWHVVKNWNFQGKKKIHDQQLKKEMKNEMKRIINETNEDKFMILCNRYLLKLQEANEMDFVNYLTRYYFQDEERIKMWAHCYRRNSGINTNMAIESLNNILKTNQLKRNARVTIEKLLDTIDDLVDIKMWKRIVDIQRPNANNYQDRIIIKAHKQAAAMTNKIKVKKNNVVFGHFQVTSFRNPNISYNVNIKQVCESECRTLYCRVCKICIHRYQCECPEYVVRNTLCKHVHLVRMHEERMDTNSVADEAAKCFGENSLIKLQQQEEIKKFITEKIEETNQQDEISQAQSHRNIQWQNLQNFVESLDDNGFTTIMKGFEETVQRYKEKMNKATRKRKMETQSYFPSKKRPELQD